MRNLREDLEPGHAGHLDVEKHEVGFVRLDFRERLPAVGALGHNLEVFCLGQAQLDAASGECLVIDDDRANVHARAALVCSPGPGAGVCSAARTGRLETLGREAAGCSGSPSSRGRAMSTRRPGTLLITANR